MNRPKLSLLVLLLVVSLLCSACAFGEYNVATKPSRDFDFPQPTNSDGSIDENPFTVVMTYNNKVFVPAAPIEVQWNDGFSLYTAMMDTQEGIAKIGGLDGDYKVTLKNVPEGYGYNANAYIATNSNRNISIELYKLSEGRGKGTDAYSPIRTSATGVYCVELKSAKDEVFFQFAPQRSGTYSVESWTDVTANEINPMANYYGANPMFATLRFTQNDGGEENTYTKNFRLNVEIADENIAQGGGGAAAFTFGIKATQKNEEYPVKIFIAIKWEDSFILEHAVSNIIFPQELVERGKLDEYDPLYYTFVGAESEHSEAHGSYMVFDADNYKFWDKKDGGDGFYHLYDFAKYPQTNGYGPILYAHISSACRFMDEPFSSVEHRGNKALTVSNGTENYKLFIEGYQALSGAGALPPYFCVSNCPCREDNTCTSNEILGKPGACATGCTKCHPDCRQLEPDQIGTKGYANYANSDGMYPVTQELKEFLQKYSINQLLFMDGEGFCETHPEYKVFATEEDQWLFACGYYKEK